MSHQSFSAGLEYLEICNKHKYTETMEYSSGSTLSFSIFFINNFRELRHGVSSKFLVKHPLDLQPPAFIVTDGE